MENHQESDLLQVFEGVHRNLSEGGTFLFDVHSLFQMDHVFPGYQYIYQEESEVFLWESFIGDYDHSVEHVLTFFVENCQLVPGSPSTAILGAYFSLMEALANTFRG